jgi:hypothetical protein
MYVAVAHKVLISALDAKELLISNLGHLTFPTGKSPATQGLEAFQEILQKYAVIQNTQPQDTICGLRRRKRRRKTPTFLSKYVLFLTKSCIVQS